MKSASQTMTGFGEKEKNNKKKARLHDNQNQNGKTLLRSAINYHKNEDFINAERKYREAIKSGYKHSSIFSNLGIICKNTGRLDEAIHLYEKAIEIDPKNPEAYSNIGNLYIDLSNLDQALASTRKCLELKPDHPAALTNLGRIYQLRGDLDQALASTLKSLKLKPDSPNALINLGIIYQELGNLDQALSSTLKCIELKPDNPNAYMNLGNIYKDLGKSDQALNSVLKSLRLKPNNSDSLINLAEIYIDIGNFDKAIASIHQALKLKPDDSRALCKQGRIKMALGQMISAKKDLLKSIDLNNQEYEAYYALSTMLDTREEAEEALRLMKSVTDSGFTPLTRAFVEFAKSNCLHKAKKFESASRHIKLANKNKLIAFPSNAEAVLHNIASSISDFAPVSSINVSTNSGKERIFIVGMPRSGSTMLETMLGMNPEIKCLGECRSLAKAIGDIRDHKQQKLDKRNLNDLYSKIEPIDFTRYKYTTDKQLYNFVHIHWIANHMPAAKIIHCKRNPLDNILSMQRSNLAAGNNYTASVEDSAKVLIAQEKAMQAYKQKYAKNIFTFDYDQFVNEPEKNLCKLLKWLGLKYSVDYLHPEDSKRVINTASVMQARRSISNKYIEAWKNYQDLLKPAINILREGGILDESLNPLLK